MDIAIIVAVAAVAFSFMAGAIEVREARRARRRLLERLPVVLHPLGPGRRPRLPAYVSRRRALRHVALFIGFLLAVYVGAATAQAVHSLLAGWLR